ncbi:aldehyde dehydrogenase family protein, partial [Ralstonia pseudosolanacearum]
MQQRDTLFINGQWVAPQGKGTIDVIHSTTEAVMGTIPEGSAADAEAAVAAARAAFDGWAAT